MAGEQLVHACEHGLRVVQVLEAQVLRKHRTVDSGRELRVCVERLDFGTVDEPVAVLRVVERFDAEDVARADELLSHVVPDGDCEHATQTLEDAHAPFLVTVHDDFGVTVRRELVARRAQLVAQFPEVVDLAVERDGHVSLGVAHGLFAALEVDDRQAAETHRDAVVDVVAVVVGAAVLDAVGHVAHDGEIGLGVVVDCREPHESAHACCASDSFRSRAYVSIFHRTHCGSVSRQTSETRP